jgi:hypothetical protein
MGFYRISSQLTDFILDKTTPSAAEKYFAQIKAAIHQLGDLGVMSPVEALRVARFQANPKETMTDDEMATQVGGEPRQAAQTVNQMYLVLNQLARTGQLGIRTQRLLERFMEGSWKPLDEGAIEEPEQEGQIAPGVVKGRRRAEPQEVPEIPEAGNVPRWEAPEERMIEEIERRKAAFDLLVTAGILEIIPDLKERQARLAERKYAWAALLRL